MNRTTGTTGTIGHPDVSEISDLAEGLLSPARAAEVRAHLGGCALCADVRASLDEIRGLLGTLPGPARMPVDISGRIDAALAAEALLDATHPARPSTAGPRPGPERGVSRETPASTPGGAGAERPSGHPAGPSGPGRRRARRRIAVLTGLAGAGACALGVFLFADFSGPPAHDTTARSDAASSSAQPPAANGAYTRQGLQDSVRQLLASGPGAKTAPGEQNTYGLENTAPGPGLAPGDDRAAARVPSCVQDGTGRTESPLAAERGSYQGAAVYLLVLPHPGDASRVDAYVVDSACASTASGTPGKLMLTSTHPRG
ncbi:zf-HC2 domain-containing protein [Streptomyces sp. NPDC058655]|uniref:zf-HC2 domain-containing protein n=1 Tax=Streptomyces sp. NPDC058655 TaxID=3346577 RepID=UPI00364E267D